MNRGKLNHGKLAWGVEAFTELGYAGTTNVGQIIDGVSMVREVHAAHTIAGDPDALIQVRSRYLAYLQEVIDRLRRSATVTGTKTLTLLGRWRRG